MLPERFQKQVDLINQYPINKHARKLLEKEGVSPTRDEVHSLHLLRVFLEQNKVDPRRRANSNLEQPAFELMEMTTWNPQKMSDLLELKQIEQKPIARQLVEELMERINGLEQENKI